LKHFGIHTFNFSGEQVILSLNDAHRMRGDRVGASRSKVVGGKPLQDLVREPVGCIDRQLQRFRVCDARAVQV
jgi:hypothetical protein